MIAIKAHFDGHQVILPDELHAVPPGDVILVFEGDPEQASEVHAWMKAEEQALAEVWDNNEDAVYDSL